MRFRILGPLEAIVDGSGEGSGRSLELGGVKQRALLGMLLLQPNRVVATSKLLTALWSDVPPPSARKVVQNAVWGLRRVFAAGASDEHPAVLLTRAPGYVLCVAPDRVDLHCFQQLARRGREALVAGEPQKASELLGRARELWHGPVLADLVETGIGWAELAAVGRSGLDATEDWFEAELACGRHFSVLGELESLAEAEPHRERLSGQLMLALYRCGRQTDALGVYHRVRTALREQHGLEPGRELQRLERAILTHDVALRGPGPLPAPRPDGHLWQASSAARHSAAMVNSTIAGTIS